MKAIGTVKSIDIAGLTEYVINRKEYQDIFKNAHVPPWEYLESK